MTAVHTGWGRLYFLFTVLCLLALSGVSMADTAGAIVFAAGDARLREERAAVGDTVRAGDQLATGDDGYLYIKTVDEGFLILRPGSKAEIVAYRTDPDNPADNRIKIELRQGVARSVSGAAVKRSRDHFRFNTPVAAIGVRGTDFTVYTDADTTRVSVRSGGVVVSGFGPTCSPGGIGPCEGASSRELFADSAGILQVSQGATAPLLLRDKRLSPDTVAPPHPEEPQADESQAETPATERSSASQVSTQHRAGGTESGAIGGDPSLAPLKQAELDQATRKVPGLPVVEQPLPPPPVVEPVPAVTWGRWQKVINQPAELDLDKLANDYKLVATNRYYAVLQRREQPFVAPSSGTVVFSLLDAQAVVEGATRPAIDASVENGSLKIDFGKQRFETRLELVYEGRRVPRAGNGHVAADGLFGNATQSGANTMIVNGALGGDAVDMDATYIFRSRLDDGRIASGVTTWQK